LKVPEIFQVETSQAPDGLGSVLHEIAEAGLVVEHVSAVLRNQDHTLWEITVDIDESAHAGLLERLNALPSARFVGWSDRQTGATLQTLTVGVVGLGAAGLGIAKLLQAHGVKQLLGNDLRATAMGRLAQWHGQGRTLDKILAHADVLICTTGAQRLLAPEHIRTGQIVFALSNPDPEIDPAAALAAGAAVAADGKSINTVLCFPGLFDAVLRTRVRAITDEMLLAAARALASAAPAGQLLPDPLDLTVRERVSRAVQTAIIGAAHGSVPTDTRRAEDPPEVSNPQSGEA